VFFIEGPLFRIRRVSWKSCVSANRKRIPPYRSDSAPRHNVPRDRWENRRSLRSTRLREFCQLFFRRCCLFTPAIPVIRSASGGSHRSPAGLVRRPESKNGWIHCVTRDPIRRVLFGIGLRASGEHATL